MENWGLVTYRETNLLYDPLTSSNRNKETTATIIAHELAHMVSWRWCCMNAPERRGGRTDRCAVFSGAVVWKPGDSEMVERGVAERGLCFLRVLPGGRPCWAWMECGEDPVLVYNVPTLSEEGPKMETTQDFKLERFFQQVQWKLTMFVSSAVVFVMYWWDYVSKCKMTQKWK